MRAKQKQKFQMNTLQCEVCVQQLSAETASEPAASLFKASEAAEMLHPVYIYCSDCKQHLCKPCDYKAHVLQPQSTTTNASKEQDDSAKSNKDNDQLFSESHSEITNTDQPLQSQKTGSPQNTQTKLYQKSEEEKTRSAPKIFERLIANKMEGNQESGKPSDEPTTKEFEQVIVNHERLQICEECTAQKSSFFCTRCEQTLCAICWERIHNKAARRRHKPKQLNKPLFYPPHMWKKTSSMNQQSAGSSSLQDSLSQFKQENVLEEMNDALTLNEKGRASLLSQLKVNLNSDTKGICPQPPSTLAEISKSQRQSDQNSQPQPGHYHGGYGLQQAQYTMQMPHQQNKYPEYGQSPQYIPPQYTTMQQSQMPLNAAPFQPQIGMSQRNPQFGAQNKIQMIPQQFGLPGFHNPQGAPHHGMYIYPDHQPIPGQFVGFDSYGRQIHQHQVGPQAMYQNQMMHSGQQQHHFDMQTAAYQNQLQFSNQISEFAPNLRSKSNQPSEDESLSSGIHEEATHHKPQAYDLKGARQAPSSSIYEVGEGRIHDIDLEENVALMYNLKQDNSHLVTRQNHNLLSQDESSTNSHINMPSGVFKNPETGKSFTPLRKGQQNSSDCIPSPLLSTPIEQSRAESYKNSKLLTPPITMGGQNRSNFKIKLGGANSSSQHISKGNRPLKVPKGHAYINAQSSLLAGKPPIASYERKGPHIQYQVKTSKPSSMSSHEMDSDCGCRFQSGHQCKKASQQFMVGQSANHQQKSFEAYQLYTPQHQQSSQSAKNNYRNQQLAARGVGGKPDGRDPDSRDYSPEYHEKSRVDHHGLHKYAGSSANNSSSNTNSEKRQYKLKATGSERPLNSSYGCYNKYDTMSQGSTSKPGSLSNQKSGSGGNQGGSSYVMRGTPSRANQEGMASRNSSGRWTVQIFQPVVQVDRRSLAGRSNNIIGNGMSAYEETKHQRDLPLSFSEENKLMHTMQLILFQNAAQGDLLILKSRFVEQIVAKEASLDQRLATSAVNRAVNYGIIHQTDRNFADAKTIEFISLKIQIFSHQCLQWVITSLRRDEMTPTESAIKNRTKEAFDFKIQNDNWDAIMKSIQTTTNNSNNTQSKDSADRKQKQSITPPDKGSSAHTQGHPSVYNAATNINTSLSQSSASSTNQPLTTTTTTVSAHGITKITLKQSVVTEADSGSTVRNQVLGTGSDSHERNEAGKAQTNSSGTNQDGQFSLPQEGPFSSQNSSEMVAPRFKVVLQQLEDEYSQGLTSAGCVKSIYMEDEEVWLGVDIEDDSTVDLNIYEVMISFLKDYFCPSQTPPQSSSFKSKENNYSDSHQAQQSSHSPLEDNSQNVICKDNNSQDSTLQMNSSDLRMIPGGRYGCTQFLKICGPEPIRRCSVGKTTQMVQLAIKEDILRHLKTQIVWSTQVDRHKSELDTFEDQQITTQRKAKLEKVKEAIIEILAESKTGMSLAQLPQYLKKKLVFNLEWNELGFPKLKDLLKSMEDTIKVELRDVNHPFAFLVHKKKNKQSQHQAKTSLDKNPFHRNTAISEQNQDGSTRQMVYCSEKLQQVVQAVFTLLQMEPRGIKENELSQLIQEQLNFEFKKEDLGCGSLYEFVQKYIMRHDDSIEFITLPECGKKSFMFRSNKILSKFCNQMEKEEQLQRIASENQNRHAGNQGAGAAGGHFYPSSYSHKNFNRGPSVNNGQGSSYSFEPSDVSSDQLVKDHRQQRIQTQPNDHQMPRFYPQFPTCESQDGGDDTISQCSSMKNVEKAISDLSIDLDSQKSAIMPPFTQQAQKMTEEGTTSAEAHAAHSEWLQRHMHQQQHHQQQIQQHHHQQQQKPQYYPWLPAHSANDQLGKNGGPNNLYQGQAQGQQQYAIGSKQLDNVQINANIHLQGVPLGQTLHVGSQMMPFFSMPIDQTDNEDENRLVVQQQHGGRPQQLNQNYEPLNFGEIDSPRVQQQMKYLFKDSPADQNPVYPHQHQQTLMENANNASEFETQYNQFSEHIMNQSIFSEPLEKPSRKLGASKDAGHISLDEADIEARPADICSEQEIYCPLLPQKQFDQFTNNSWHANLPLSNKLDERLMGSKPQHLQIPPADVKVEQPRITEETSGSQHSSNHQSPTEVVDQNINSNHIKERMSPEQTQN